MRNNDNSMSLNGGYWYKYVNPKHMQLFPSSANKQGEQKISEGKLKRQC